MRTCVRVLRPRGRGLCRERLGHQVAVPWQSRGFVHQAGVGGAVEWEEALHLLNVARVCGAARHEIETAVNNGPLGMLSVLTPRWFYTDTTCWIQ